MSDRLPLLRILLISHTVDAILPPMESNRQRDSVSLGKDTKKRGSRSDARREARKGSMKKGASREPKARPGGPIRLKRRRATLPHPLECSTIAAPGLSYRVRNGTGRLTRAMTTANLTATAGKPKESKPANQSFVAVREPDSGREAQSPSESNRDHQALIVAWDRSTGKTRNQPPYGWNVVSPSPVSTGRLHPSRDFHPRPIKHVFNMRATTVQDCTES